MSPTTVSSPTRDRGRFGGRVARRQRLFTTDLSHPPLPRRGLTLSALVHALFVLATMVVPWSYWIPAAPRLITQEQQMREQPLLLPSLQPRGGGRPSAAVHGGGQGRAARHPKPAPANKARASRGAVFKGPQLIVSNPKRPDNYRQTILQPALIKAPTLPAPLPVPPMISVAAPAPALRPPAKPAPKAARPVPVLRLSASRALPKVEAPKLPLPAAAQPMLAARMNAPAVLPTLAPVKPVPVLPPSASRTLSKVKAPKLASAATPQLPAPVRMRASNAVPTLAPARVPVEGQASGTQNLLVVDALPTRAAPPAEIPPGELHGSFTVSPMGTTAPGLAGGGELAEGKPGNASGTLQGAYAGAGSAKQGSSGAGSGAGSGPASGNVAGTGSGSGAGVGNGGASQGSGPGRGAGTIARAGSGKGSGSGGGRGGGRGSGSSPFPEVMIQGASAGNSPGGGGRTSFAISFGPQTQPSYGITIVASGASGGGFPDYGIFRHDTSYTVYLNMSDQGLAGQNWPLQYALLRKPGTDSSDPPQGAPLLAPFPESKVLPEFGSKLAARNRGRKVVVLGVIDQSGNWVTLRVVQSPDPELNAAVLRVLPLWNFRPAEMNGTPVSVKCLLGVTVNPPQP